jgi:hypothetical protein
MRTKGILGKRTALLGAMLTIVAMFAEVTPAANAAAGNTALKIYELAGAGALSGANYRQDTIVLFNPTQAAINCTTCAIQTHSGTSLTSSWTVYKLPTLSIPAGGYYMISASSVSLATYGNVAPIPYDYELQTIEDGGAANIPATQNILSSTTGTVALTSTTTALTIGGSPQCGTGSQLLDLVGYGSSFSTQSVAATPNICYAGTAPAYYDGNTTTGRQLGILRKNKCIDTFNNGNDFVNIGLVYYNSQSAPSVCPTGTQLSAAVTATPSNPGVTESVTFTAVVTPATSPNSSGITAYVDMNSVYYNGAMLPMTSNGSGTYSLTTTIPTGTVPGFTYPTNVTVNDALGNTYIGSTNISVATGSFSMTSQTTSGTVSSGGVLTFPITITGMHGYGGILNITCVGTPNANNLGVPISTQCVSTPAELTLANDGTGTLSLAIATGTTFSAGMMPRQLTAAILGLFSMIMLSTTIWRRKRLAGLVLMGLLAVVTMNTTVCGTDGGLGNTGAAAGTYTYVVTATDSNISTITNSLTFTVTVQ